MIQRGDICQLKGYGEGPAVPRSVDIIDFLEHDAPAEFYLSVKACEGIIRMAERRHKEISP